MEHAVPLIRLGRYIFYLTITTLGLVMTIGMHWSELMSVFWTMSWDGCAKGVWLLLNALWFFRMQFR
ncbi:MAG: hypothetical protein AAGA75_00435 [Cyanobacteria bacterium P01_E01_bin.6]